MKKNAFYYNIKKNQGFSSRVLSCDEVSALPDSRVGAERVYCVTLSVEGFYPEGGGQPCDRGYIGEAGLISVQELSSVREEAVPDTIKARFSDISDEEMLPVLHYISMPLKVGEEYDCRLDWDWRRRLSQNHSGEHIFSGLVNARFGYSNVGFHMRMEAGELPPGVTADFDGELSWEDALSIERQANRVIWDNVEIRSIFSGGGELMNMPYRSKRELEGAVRLIEIPGADMCACCGTHVERSGEIGLIKLISVTRHRGGSRVELLCGELALDDYELRRAASTDASQLLSVPPSGLKRAIEHQLGELEIRAMRIGLLNERFFKAQAELLEDRELICDFQEGMNSVELRRYCDYLMRNTSAHIVAVFLKSKSREGYSYVIGSLSMDLREGGKLLNSLRNGRGGGQPSMLQGSLVGSREEIEKSVREAFYGA